MFINYSDREVKLLDYRLPNAIVCDVQDILHAISIDSEEALCATVESLECVIDSLIQEGSNSIAELHMWLYSVDCDEVERSKGLRMLCNTLERAGQYEIKHKNANIRARV